MKKVKSLLAIVLAMMIAVCMFSFGISANAAASIDRTKPIDLVFILDSTGSMRSYINHVRNNLNDMVNKLNEEGINVQIAIIDYKDVLNTAEHEENSTVVHKDGSSIWFKDADKIASELSSINITGGGDNPETPTSGLAEMLGSGWTWRKNSSKFAFVLTDADYHDGDAIDSTPPSMTAVTDKLAAKGVHVSVASETEYEPDYNYLYTKTNGKFFDIYADSYMLDLTGWLVSALKNTSTVSAESINIGGSVTVKADAADGKAPYSYAVFYSKVVEGADRTWVKVQDYGTNQTVKITPEEVGSYEICVKVRDADNTVEKQYFDLKVTSDFLNKSTISADTIKVGETVTVKGAAKGGSGTYKYAVLYKKTTDTKWATAQEFKENSKVTIKPGKVAKYDICVKVSDGNTIVKKYFVVKVTSAIAHTTTLSVNGTGTATVNCGVSKPTGAVTYAVYYRKASDSKWITAQDYKDNAKVSFTLEKDEAYVVCVKAKDSTKTIVKRYFYAEVL